MVEKIHVLNLEGYALNGMVEDFTLEDCKWEGKVRLSRVKAKLRNGEEIMTDCMEYPRAARLFVLLEKYKNLSKSIVIEGLDEEVMKGITYDLDLKPREGDD
ncbi:MAG: hypothetical protein J7L55_03040 [Desulfurococcales archaeon]|nr:hypothetical protein [Desulfurococcales archaeon]